MQIVPSWGLLVFMGINACISEVPIRVLGECNPQTRPNQSDILVD